MATLSSRPGSAAVEARGLERRYKGGLLAVDGLDLRVDEGEIYAFLGPNGAGKTTCVRIFTTLLRPTAGQALVAGHDVRREPGLVRRAIGVALQEAALDGLMTGRELIRLQGALHGLTRTEARRRGDELLERVDIVEAADRRVATYSGGMRRRLDLALALVNAPRVLFLDEPTTGLDPVSRSALWTEVRRLNDDGTTVFLTTQYLEEADQLADRVGIINRGRLEAEGTPAQLKARVGEPTIAFALATPTPECLGEARRALAQFGEVLEADAETPNVVEVRTAQGAGAIAPAVRALDAHGLAVEQISVHTPTLDDVFMAVTGHRLAPAEAGPGGADEPPAGDPAADEAADPAAAAAP